MKIFISYAHEDFVKVKKYVTRLEKEPLVSLFWDKEIKAGDDFLEVIAKEADGALALIVFVSKNSCESEYVKKEVLTASDKNIKIIPIYLEDMNDSNNKGLMLLLKGIQYIPAYEMRIDKSYRKLIESLWDIDSRPL